MATKPKSKSVPGAKKAEKIKKYRADIQKNYGSVDDDFLAIIVKNLGPSIYLRDAESVSCGDSKELDTVKNNFLIKKLGLTSSDDELNALIAEVCNDLKDQRVKFRATFYYALAKKLKMESALS